LCMQRPVREMVGALKPYYLLIISDVFVMVVLISILASVFIRRAIIRPVAKVSQEAARFAQEGTKGGSLVDISQYDVIRDLAGSIDSMETDMLQYIDTLTKATADKERIGAELSIAATIQKDSLPDVFRAFPQRNDFQIYATMDPAKEVGGDFYNFFLIHRDQLAVVMADVSGKGIPAALFMMLTNILIESRARMGGTPSEILAYVNKSICKRNRADMFVTVWLGILNTTTGRMVYANAGHEDAAIYRKGGQFEITKEKHSFVLGGMDGIQYQDREIQLNQGDKLFLYTDGIPEATDKDNQMFTLQRMLDSLNEHKEKSPEKILDGVRNDVNTFVWHAPQFDDMTMLCLEIKEGSPGSSEE
ncbi:MAG: SpoIIE family protein phosphatase, partial [Clostridiales bacterium]|nr:SpoIIE family protein phosphatase [Clostridiales bacterium]